MIPKGWTCCGMDRGDKVKLVGCGIAWMRSFINVKNLRGSMLMLKGFALARNLIYCMEIKQRKKGSDACVKWTCPEAGICVKARGVIHMLVDMHFPLIFDEEMVTSLLFHDRPFRFHPTHVEPGAVSSGSRRQSFSLNLIFIKCGHPYG